MSKINKLINTVSNYQFTFNNIIRDLEIINLYSGTGLLIKEIWEENIEEYGEIRYIFKQSLEDIYESKYNIICAIYDKIENIFYTSNWCIQIPD